MKKIILSLVCLTISVSLFAQKVLPEIKAGTKMNASVFVQGQQFPLTFSIKSVTSPVSIEWAVEGYGGGEFVMTDKAVESATSIFMKQPGMGTTTLGDTETYGLISKAAYKSLVDTQATTYSGIKFKVKTPDTNPMKFGGKEVDAMRIASEDGKIELWILNNANFPLILQTAGMPLDMVVTDIK